MSTIKKVEVKRIRDSTRNKNRIMLGTKGAM